MKTLGRSYSSVRGDSDTVLLLYVGRVVPEKNLPLLVELCGNLPRYGQDYRTLIAGEASGWNT